MKSAKEILASIKAMFDAPVIEPVAAPVQLEAKVYKLQDGSEISIAQASEILSVGDMVTVGGALPNAGEYTLEDGQVIVVDAAGAITEIKPAAPITNDLGAVPQPTLEERIAALESKMEQMIQPAIPTGLATEAQYQEALKQIAKQGEVINGLFELAEKLTEEPTADPKTLTGNKKEAFEREASRNSKLDRIREARKTMKSLS